MLPYGNIYSGLFISLGVENEVKQRLQFWESQLCEIETRYQELSKKCTRGSLTKAKQRGKKRQKVQVPDGELSQLSDYAAEVVFRFFLKVIKLISDQSLLSIGISS